VRYAPAHSTADTVIEREVYKGTHRMSCVVVSNDRGLRDLCRGMGALVMEASNYLESLSELQRDVTDTLRQTQIPKPVFLEESLSPEMMEQLRQLKEKLK
jgi:predicted RNA-binding protein with PIN domain